MPTGVYIRNEFTAEHKTNLRKSWTPQRRQNYSLRLKGRPIPEERKYKIRIGSLGKIMSEESRKAMSVARRGKKLSESHKAAIGRGLKGRPSPTKGMVPWNKGVKGISYHTEESRRKLSEFNKAFGKHPPHKKGKDHYNWKGGITPENSKIRHSLEYNEWRNAVFERDDWTCQKYKIKGCYLHAHHIENFHSCSEKRVSVDNGIALSEKAHNEFHTIYGKKNNTREQLDEFLLPPKLLPQNIIQFPQHNGSSARRSIKSRSSVNGVTCHNNDRADL